VLGRHTSPYRHKNHLVLDYLQQQFGSSSANSRFERKREKETVPSWEEHSSSSRFPLRISSGSCLPRFLRAGAPPQSLRRRALSPWRRGKGRRRGQRKAARTSPGGAACGSAAPLLEAGSASRARGPAPGGHLLLRHHSACSSAVPRALHVALAGVRLRGGRLVPTKLSTAGQPHASPPPRGKSWLDLRGAGGGRRDPHGAGGGRRADQEQHEEAKAACRGGEGGERW
jgi:hypothetical protein